MTEQDFLLIARVLMESTQLMPDDDYAALARSFADALATKPNFDRGRFLTACDVRHPGRSALAARFGGQRPAFLATPETGLRSDR